MGEPHWSVNIQYKSKVDQKTKTATTTGKMLTVNVNKLAARAHEDYKCVKPRLSDVKPDIPRMRQQTSTCSHHHHQQHQNIAAGDILPLPGKKRTFPGLRSPITLYIAGKLSEDELKKKYRSAAEHQFDLVRPSMRQTYSVPPNTPLNVSTEKMFDGVIDHHLEVEIADYEGSISGRSTIGSSSGNEYENQETEDALTSGSDEDDSNVEESSNEQVDYKALIHEKLVRIAREAGDGSTASSEDEPSGRATGRQDSPDDEFLKMQRSVFNMDAVMKVLNDDGDGSDGEDEVDIDELFNDEPEAADGDLDEFHEIADEAEDQD